MYIRIPPDFIDLWFNPKNVHLYYQFMGSLGRCDVYFHTIYFPFVGLGDGCDDLSTTGEHVLTCVMFDADHGMYIQQEYLDYDGGRFSKRKFSDHLLRKPESRSVEQLGWLTLAALLSVSSNLKLV